MNEIIRPAVGAPGELVAVAVLHAGDDILLPDHGALLLVHISQIVHGTTSDRQHEGRNLCFCVWQAAADPLVHGTTGLGAEDQVRRVHEGLAA